MQETTEARFDTQCHAGAESSEIRIMLVAGVRLYRDGLASELGARPGLTLVALAGDFESALVSFRASHPDVILLDVRTPRTYELVRVVRKEQPAAQVVAFAVDDSEQDIAVCA